MNFSKLFLFCTVLIFLSCSTRNPNLDDSGVDELKALEIDQTINTDEQGFSDVIYVPVYSDIYFDALNPKTLLSATLSIRNTSISDSLFITKIEYYDTEGNLVRKYIDNPISLKPMASINYVIDRDDDIGGHGANFIVDVSAKKANTKPLIQAVMIGQSGNKGFSFISDGYSLK